MKRSVTFFSLLLGIVLLTQPLLLSAQTPASTTVRQQYNPNVSVESTGNSFSGVRFSGVGGAVAGCANVGKWATKGINALFGIATKFIDGPDTVPVSDTKTKEELQNLNKTTQCLDGVAYAVAKNLLQQVAEKTLSWVNTGFAGNPLYVRDMGSYMSTIRDEQLQKYLQYVPNSNPIFGNAIRSAITQQVTGRSDGLLNRTMNTPEAVAYENFQQDFTQGGWSTFLNPNNNPVGAFFNATDEISGSINAQQEDIRDELARNDGFLDMKRCVEYANDGQVLDGNGNPICLRYETTTPGSIIAEQTAFITNSPARQLEQADEINEVLGSFFDKLLNRLFAEGLASLRTRGGNSGSVSNGPGSNTVIGTNGNALSTPFGTSGLGYELPTGGFDPQDFDISRPQQVRAITQAQYNFQNRVFDSMTIANRIVPTLGALDYCIPGPNPTWENGLKDNYTTFLSALQTPSKDDTFFRRLFSNFLGGLFGGNSDYIDYALAGKPVLYDKVTDSSQEMKPVIFEATNHNRTAEDIENYLNHSFSELLKEYRAAFSTDAITDAFVAVDSNPTFARAIVRDAIRETANIVTYNANLADLNNQYDAALLENEDALIELEAIRAEVNSIVKVAKARYISEQAAAGTPVNMQCINQAYIIDESPIVGTPRLEPDVIDPIIQQSMEASEYFYNTLKVH